MHTIIENTNKLTGGLENQVSVEGQFCIEDVYCRYSLKDFSLPLIITFSPLGEGENKYESYGERYIQIQKKEYLPWGYKYVKSLGFNIISFSPLMEDNWYRNPYFHLFLEKLGLTLKKIPNKKYGIGASMGAYGISAFANVLNLNKILLMSPISTLNHNLVSFEKRYGGFKKYNWCNNYHDGATALCEGYVIYDPIYHFDVLHAKRYKNLQHLKLPGIGHLIPIHLQNLSMLPWIMQTFIKDGLINKKTFCKQARKRREYKPYYDWLLSKDNRHLTERRRIVIEKHQQNNIQSDKL